MAPQTVPDMTTLDDLRDALRARERAEHRLGDVVNRLPSSDRRKAVSVLYEAGLRKTAIARLLGVSPQRITQILDG